MSRKGRRAGKKQSYTVWIILALVVVTGIIGYLIFTQSGTGSGSPLNGTPVSQTVLNQLSGVSLNTLNTVGSGAAGVTPVKPVTNPAPLTLNGKPEVLYMGAEYCPFCASERWAMIVALDKFGNFSGLQYTESAPLPEAYPNTATFSFRAATYTSNYISFASVEQQDRNHNPLQTATANQTALLNLYDTAGSIPFVDIANAYTLTGSQLSPPVLRVGGSSNGAPYNWTQISSQLDNSSSVFALNIDGAANRLISAICKVDGSQPASICSQSFAQVVSFIKSPSASIQPLVSDAAFGDAPLSATAPRFAPDRVDARV